MRVRVQLNKLRKIDVITKAHINRIAVRRVAISRKLNATSDGVR